MSDACCGGPDTDATPAAPPALWRVPDLRLAGSSGVLLLASFLAGRSEAPSAALALAALALLLAGLTFVPGALLGLRRGRVGIGGLMTIAAVGAVLLGEVEQAAALAFLFSIAEGLESWSMARTRYGLRALLSLVPDRASVLRGGLEVVVAPAELLLGDVLVVRPGERLATDGIVRTGSTALDVSSITGESMPVEVGPGSPVYAGSVNGGGALEV